MGISSKPTFRYPALLLLGPTGSGKTPTGQYIEEAGFQGKRCLHFDFGEKLRMVAGLRQPPSYLTPEDFAVVLDSIKKGTLLENEHFPIAAKIFHAFLQERGAKKSGLVILNGLPRHLGQAADVDRMVDVQVVINLTCEPEMVRQRIRLNSGGDRTGRADDDIRMVEHKMKLYRERTSPLVDYYRRQGAEIRTIAVELNTTPQDVLRQSS